MRTILPAFLALTFFVSLLAITPQATAQSVIVIETFEDDAIPGLGSTGNPAADWYTYSTAANNGFVTTERAYQGSKSLRIQPLSGSGASVTFTPIGTSIDWCDADDGSSLWVYMTTLPPATTIDVFSLQGGLLTTGFETRITSAGALQFGPGNNLLTISGITIPTDTWFDLGLGGSCSSSTNSQACLYSITLVVNTCRNLSAGGGYTATADTVVFTAGSASPYTRAVWIDDLAVSGYVAAPQVFLSFCADPANINVGPYGTGQFGYEYVEGVTFDTPGPLSDISINDAFLFQGDNDNSDWLGKEWTTGSKSFKTVFRIEASSSDASSTIFRAAYTLGGGGNPSLTARGSDTSMDGGSFDDHIHARFEESGSRWRITIEQNTASAGIQAIGAAVNYNFNPNNARTFSFTVDSREASGRYAVIKDTVTGADIVNRTLPVAFSEAVWKDSWFVGRGSTGALDAFTYLDDPDEGDEGGEGRDSTCVFDLTGTATVGPLGPGIDPPSTVPTPPGQTITVNPIRESLEDAFDIPAEAANVLLAIIWILIFAAGAYGIFGGQVIGIALGGILGFVFALFQGLLPEILVFIIVLLAAAAVGFRFFGSRGSPEGM